MNKEQKVVALIRRHLAALASCPLSGIDAALTNLENAQQAAANLGYEELSDAVMSYDTITSPSEIAIVQKYIKNPNEYIADSIEKAAKFHDLLT
jgi:predicted component of type VI protein secretion system